MSTLGAASRGRKGNTHLEIDAAVDGEEDGIFNDHRNDSFSVNDFTRRYKKWWAVALVVAIPAGIVMTILNSGESGSKIVYDPMKFSEEFEQHKNGNQIYDPDMRPDDPIQKETDDPTQKETPLDPGRFYNDHQAHTPQNNDRPHNAPPVYEDGMTSRCLENVMHSYTGESWQSFFEDLNRMSTSQRCSGPDSPPTNQGCSCPDPMEPAKRTGQKYEDVFKHNKEKLMNAPPDLDMVMIGDSIMEFWQDGTYMGEHLPQLAYNRKEFKEKFGNRVIANGISGDRTTNLAYRVLNGEMPNDFNPKIWWILVGTNDWGVHQCHAHTISAGILNVVQIVRKARPVAPIVINAILPRDNVPMETSESWQVISRVNRYLACYVHDHAQTMNLRFVNDTDLFLTESDGKTEIKHSMMKDYLHPSSSGYATWADRILGTLDDILKEGT